MTVMVLELIMLTVKSRKSYGKLKFLRSFTFYLENTHDVIPVKAVLLDRILVVMFLVNSDFITKGRQGHQGLTNYFNPRWNLEERVACFCCNV